VEEDFVASIRTGAPVRLTSFPDGVRYMRFVDAAWRSWNERRAVAVTPA
jgi:predicted dehydrogenase